MAEYRGAWPRVSCLGYLWVVGNPKIDVGAVSMRFPGLFSMFIVCTVAYACCFLSGMHVAVAVRVLDPVACTYHIFQSAVMQGAEGWFFWVPICLVKPVV